MNLIDKLKKENIEAFEKWFERWYAKENIEKYIIQANQQGYTAIKIKIYKKPDYGQEVDNYAQLRLRNPLTTNKIAEKLGGGFYVNHVRDENKLTPIIKGIERWSIDEYILIKWEDNQ